VLKDLPLTSLGLDGCTQLRDLELVRGMKQLRHLRLWGCNQVDDLSPLTGLELRTIALNPRFIKKGWQVLWDMKSLDTVIVEGRGDFRTADFRKKLEEGGFK